MLAEAVELPPEVDELPPEVVELPANPGGWLREDGSGRMVPKKGSPGGHYKGNHYINAPGGWLREDGPKKGLSGKPL